MYIYACASDLPNLPEAHSSLPRKSLSVAHKSGPMFWPKAMVPSKHKLHTYIHMSDSTDVPRTGVCVWHIHINYVFSSVQFRPPVSPRAFISVASKLANTLIAGFCCGLRATHTHTHIPAALGLHFWSSMPSFLSVQRVRAACVLIYLTILSQPCFPIPKAVPLLTANNRFYSLWYIYFLISYAKFTFNSAALAVWPPLFGWLLSF